MKKIVTILVVLSTILSAETDAYFLCQGTFEDANSTLWEIDGENNEVTPAIYNDIESEPLGDTGQSLYIDGDKIFVVMNGWNQVKIMDLANGLEVEDSVSISSPRYIKTKDNNGYISSWGENAIIEVDLESYKLTDTIEVGGYPEDIVINEDQLFTSINQIPDTNGDGYTENGQYIKQIDLSKNQLVDSFQVASGPSNIIYKNSTITVKSYDYVNPPALSRIHLDQDSIQVQTGLDTLSTNYAEGFTIIEDKIYCVTKSGLVRIEENLTLDLEKQIGNIESSKVISAGNYDEKIYLGTTDRSYPVGSPDTVFVYDKNNKPLDTIQTDAMPVSFAFYNSDQTSIAGGSGVEDNEFTLNQNYPNPFNPTTTISYNLPKAKEVELTIYDVRGRKVEKLVNTKKRKGRHKIQWNATNVKGERVSTGVYYYQLQAGENVKTKSMIYIK